MKQGTTGTYGNESLPNISGSYLQTNSSAGGGIVNGSTVSGVFYTGGTGGYWSNNNAGATTAPALKFDASRSSSTYQNNAKVNPDNAEIMYIIKF